jgi:hypothetical protein
VIRKPAALRVSAAGFQMGCLLPTMRAASHAFALKALENFIGNGGSLKLVLGASEGFDLQANVLIVIFDADFL